MVMVNYEIRRSYYSWPMAATWNIIDIPTGKRVGINNIREWESEDEAYAALDELIHGLTHQNIESENAHGCNSGMHGEIDCITGETD